jgi:peptide deformylase
MITKDTVIQLVPPEQIPVAVDTPTEDLMSLFRLAAKMEAVCEREQGIGLSAVQVGIPWRFFIMKRGRSYEYYVNCEYKGSGSKEKSIEGCLSLKNTDGQIRRFEVDRYPRVQVTGKRFKFANAPALVLEDINIDETGLYSVVFQHEIDHGFQKLISDIGREIELVR